MSENFLKFKRKQNFSVILKAVLYGISAGLFGSGLFLVLFKLGVIDISPVISIPVGAGLFLIAGLAVFLVLHKSNMAFAKELDSRFGLDERVETMLAFKDEDGRLPMLQREDAERSLGELTVKKFKIRRLWICFITLLVGTLVLLTGIFIPLSEQKEPEEEVEYFELSSIQRAGLIALIEDVEASGMEEPYRTETADELKSLLSVLEVRMTRSEMQAELTKSMAVIYKITSDSSSMTELANALWGDADYEYTKALAKLIDTSAWKEPNWEDFYNKSNDLRDLYIAASADGESQPTEDELLLNFKNALSTSALKIEIALDNSKISSSDDIYTALSGLVDLNEGDEPDVLIGLKYLPDYIEYADLTYDESVSLFNKAFAKSVNEIYAAVSQKKINTNMGETVMKQLNVLFSVPHPNFERPDLTELEDSGDDDKKDDSGDDEGSGGGGVGTGATFGSDDYVLDPTTGEYVKYGTLLAKYYALMTAKIESGDYTDAQKEAILEYFDLLYGGMKKDEE